MNLIEQVLKLDAEATKGPWKRQAEDSGIITGGIAYDGEPGVVADTVPSDFSPCVSECFANAALIAFYRTAAPKLARALRVAMEFLDTQGDLGRSVLAEIEKELA